MAVATVDTGARPTGPDGGELGQGSWPASGPGAPAGSLGITQGGTCLTGALGPSCEGWGQGWDQARARQETGGLSVSESRGGSGS